MDALHARQLDVTGRASAADPRARPSRADRIGDALAVDAPVYGYEFADPAPPTPDPLRKLPFPVGASHSLDLRYIFNMGGAAVANYVSVLERIK